MAKKNNPKPEPIAVASRSNAKQATPTTTEKTAIASKNWLSPLLLVLAVTATVFYSSINNQFVNWDDDFNLGKNPQTEGFDWEHLKMIFTGHVIGGYNPFTIAVFAFERNVLGFGLNPMGYHVVNVILHLVCTFFVFRIMLNLRLSTTAATIAALLFGIHPMRVESVAWVTELKDVLFGSFYLACVFLYTQFLKREANVAEGENTNKTRSFIIIGILFIFALLSKIQAVALPLTMLALDYYFKRPLKFKLILEKIPFFLLAFAVGVIGIYFLKENKTLDEVTSFNLLERLFIGAYSFCVYLMKFIYPYEMSPLYPYPAALTANFYLSSLGVLAVLGVAFWAWRKDWRWIPFGIAFFTFNVMFVLQIVGAGQGFLADRFTYIPYIGLFFVVAMGYDLIKSQYKTIMLGVIGIFLAIYSVMTVKQIGIWKDGETLWTQVLKYYQNTPLPWGNRAQIYRDRAQYAKAMADYDKSLALKPSINFYNSRGLVHFQLNNTQKAIDDYTAAIKMDSTDKEIPEVLSNRGSAYGKLGKFDNAIDDLNRALRLDSTYKFGYRIRYLIHRDRNEYPLALKDLNKVIEFSPNDADMYFDRAIAKRVLGDNQGSLADLNAALQKAEPKNKNLPMFYLERGRAYLQAGNPTQARSDIEEAQRRGMAVPPELKNF